MSIKKLFDSTHTPKNYLGETDEKQAYKDVESATNVEAIRTKQEAFVPQIDYKDPENFAKFGSAYLYYKAGIERIVDYYPYDGSDAEINTFYNECLNIEKYIFDKLYPRTTGYVNMSVGGWGAVAEAPSAGNSYYGTPSTLEYITFKGGPHTTNATSLVAKSPNPSNNKFQDANIYDETPYVTAGMPATYGSGSRTSNLKSDFGAGVTIEFWLTTGSTTPASFAANNTQKQVVLDIWNNEYIVPVTANRSEHYGRISIVLDGDAGSGSPFLLTVQSGSSGGIVEQTIGQNINLNTLSKWHHYAIVLENTGSRFKSTLYVDGKMNQINTYANSISTLNPKNMMGRIGGLLTMPTVASSTATSGSGKLTGSMDEFRFWKTARSAEEIGKHWFTQVRGGTNSDISNTTLGIYYKFNAGITTDTASDAVILDYSGRISNGAWTGYTTNSRNTGSAIVSASAASKEYRDPIIRAEHPDVASLKKSLLASGSFHDLNNGTAFLHYMPGWVIEEQESEDGSDHLSKMCHIMGAYFDNLYLMIREVPRFKGKTYTSSSYKPVPFAKHFPQSLGLYVPELFVDSEVMERFLNRDDDSLFEGDLTETKNLIYLNLYNNLTNIFKSKGTEKAIRNVYRCFNIDDGLVRLNVYSDNNVYELQNNLKQVIEKRTSLNFNYPGNTNAVVYQRQSGAYGTSTGYQTDTTGSVTGSLIDVNYAGAENTYGLTLEADVEFPDYVDIENSLLPGRDRTRSSLFGMYTVNTASTQCLFGTDTAWVSEDSPDRGRGGLDYANMQVSVRKDPINPKNVYFQLSSSNSPYYIPLLTSSIFYDVYNNERWNLAVRIKPSLALAEIVSGATDYTYDVSFRGANTMLGDVQRSFAVTASLTKTQGHNLLGSTKRVYAGARRTNITGTVLTASDVRFAGVRYWGRYLEDNTLNQHAFDYDNSGISGSYENIAFRDRYLSAQDVLNPSMLFLDWRFDGITGSNIGGDFVVKDYSSGSSVLRENYGWIGNYQGYQHTGYGYGFRTSSANVVNTEKVSSYKFVDPERVISSDMIKILSDDDKAFGYREAIPSYRYTLEKSMQNVISEEMLNFFAGVVDFNNLIGESVNRYRMRYKGLDKLRESFFRRVTKTSTVEKFVKYYRWFDDAIAEVVAQILPASADFNPHTLNVVESHILERPKYRHLFPTTEFQEPFLDVALMGVIEMLYPAVLGRSPLGESPRPTNKHKTFWAERAERNEGEITSGDKIVDEQRNMFRDVIYSAPELPTPDQISYTTLKSAYKAHRYEKRRFGQVYRMTQKLFRPIHAGTNFKENKEIGFTYSALYPAGPVNTDDEVFVPENVLVAYEEDLQELPEVVNEPTYGQLDWNPNKKIKRFVKVNHGRHWERGLGYYNTLSKFSFPFNLMKSSVTTGYNKQIVDGFAENVELTNLHHDTYGDMFEVPMQGPFTYDSVGGHQSRHIALNRSASSPAQQHQDYDGLDNYLTRPEAWKILTGRCVGNSGSLGMVGADYPWPEANEEGENPYPMTGAQKAIYYRDYVAKRPVNIKNIAYTTASRFLGNYQHNYQVVSSMGSYTNPRRFIDFQPTLPTNVVGNRLKTDVVNIIQNIDRGTSAPSSSDATPGTSSHFDWNLDYAPVQFTGALNKSIFVGRFRAPGGREIQSRGFLDIRGAEYSVYNALPYRNLSVRKPQQPPSGSPDRQTQGIRVRDIHGKDWGLNPLLARHTARFGRDSYWVSGTTAVINGPVYTAGGPGASFLQYPGFHKVHRNNVKKLKLDSCTSTPIYSIANPLVNTKALSFAMSGYSGNRSESLIKSASFSTDFNKITISLWLYRHNTGLNGQLRGIVTFGDDVNAGGAGVDGYPTIALLCSSDYKPRFKSVVVGGTNGDWSIDAEIPSESWTHLVVTYDGTSTTAIPTFYMNAVSQSISSFQSPSDTMQSITDKYPGYSRIGNKYAGGASGYQVLSGTSIDEVSFYRTDLSASEVSTIYCSGKVLDLTSSDAPRIASTTLSANATTIAGTLSATSTDDFAESGNLQINSEIIAYNGKTSTTFTGCTRGAYQTTPANHTSGDTVTQEELVTWLRMGGGPQDIAQSDAQLTSSNDGTGPDFPESGSNVFIDVKGNNSYAIRTGNSKENNMVYNAVGYLPNNSDFAPLGGCQGDIVGYKEVCTYTTGSQYDNWYVQHPIPRTDKQYAWITGALSTSLDTLINRYNQFSPYQDVYNSPARGYRIMEGYYSGSSTGISSYFTFVSCSELRPNGVSQVAAHTPQPPLRLNTLTLENADYSLNTLGNSAADEAGVFNAVLATASIDKYWNRPLQNSLFRTATDYKFNTNYLNLLLTRRASTYGWGWKKLRQGDNPILRNERLSASISVAKFGVTQRYRMSPCTTKGRPALVNFSSPTSSEEVPAEAQKQSHLLTGMKEDMPTVENNMTLKITNNNEKLFFDSTELNDIYSRPPSRVTTPLDQIIKIIKNPPYSLKWVKYTESVFPTLYNENFSGSTHRIGYDNKYWRDSKRKRIIAGNFTENSFGIPVWQSEWCLDAPDGFLSRSAAQLPENSAAGGNMNYKKNSRAGELQNEYFSWYAGYGYAGPKRYTSFAPAALYARPHMLASHASVVSPTGPRIAETGSYNPSGSDFGVGGLIVELYGGQAKWDAPGQAGIIEGEGTSASFVAAPSEPWFDTYGDYLYQLRLIARDYAIVPEFRISEHVSDYKKYGLQNKAKLDTFEIVGTQYSSSQPSFYRDYSNSEFLKDFLDIKRESLLDAKEIRLVCSAAIRLNPYKGFYPAQRTLDLVSQFSKSYASGMIGSSVGIGTASTGENLLSGNAVATQPLMNKLFSPGILYNSIKSGMAVDYPVVTDYSKVSASFFGDAESVNPDKSSTQWAINGTHSQTAVDARQMQIGWSSGSFWDARLPFETIIDPSKYIKGYSFENIEPHPSMSFNVTAAWAANSTDGLYALMANNFFGETANFFLKDSQFTSLRSEVMGDDMKFPAGSVFGARLKVRRSTSGPRTYQYESGSNGDNTYYNLHGAVAYSGSAITSNTSMKISGTIELPQDPCKNPFFKENFTLYSRPTAFGPPISGRPAPGQINQVAVNYASTYGVMDCFNGFNWSFTPPYYNGEAWVDLVFWPDSTKTYDLEAILAETKAVYRRCDAGPPIRNTPDLAGGIPRDTSPSLIVDWTNNTIAGGGGSNIAFEEIYSGRNIDQNAMQLSASLNLFGIERVAEEEVNKFGEVLKTLNKTVGKRWVIQPKWETPHMNFNDEGFHPITAVAGNLSVPTYASASVPRGMWHQFGIIDPDPDKGIFMEIGEIPPNWLKYHYEVIDEASVYNNEDAGIGQTIHRKMKSLADLAGFNKSTQSQKLGQLAESRTIREAIVAVPYIIESVRKSKPALMKDVSGQFASRRKKFINIPMKRYKAALKNAQGSKIGDSLDTAGASIRKLTQKMERYVLPPQFDFLNNPKIKPIVMYMFEFEYELDKDDLSYIWQNLAPRDYKKMTLQHQSVAHELMDTELLTEKNLTKNQNLRWMLFKVKQRSQGNYWDLVATQVGRVPQARTSNKDRSSQSHTLSPPTINKDKDNERNTYPLMYNWPYDYLSFVELIKMDVEVLYREGQQKQEYNLQKMSASAAWPPQLREASILGGGSGIVVTGKELATGIVAYAANKTPKQIAESKTVVKPSTTKITVPNGGRKVTTMIQSLGNAPRRAKGGRTSFDASHSHQFTVDAQGNGWALETSKEGHPRIAHKHRIRNWKVYESQSSCYPDCKKLYNSSGVPPHKHTIPPGTPPAKSDESQLSKVDKIKMRSGPTSGGRGGKY